MVFHKKKYHIRKMHFAKMKIFFENVLKTLLNKKKKINTYIKFENDNRIKCINKIKKKNKLR